MTTLPELLSDLDDEYRDARGLVERLADDAAEWDLPTPAEGWAVRDQISHLAFFDEAGRLAMVDPSAFAALVDEALAAGGDPMRPHLDAGRSMGGDQLLDWWARAHGGLVESFTGADPSVRVPWFGPPMGAISFVTARLMETWAHGRDVADALGIELAPTDRLVHIVHLGVRTRPYSYAVRGLGVPPGQIELSLTAPSGATWRHEVGESDPTVEPSGIEGTALDFCLVVTQRANVADTGLSVHGILASEWLSLAQAFAGPPGPGRPPR